MDGGGSYMGFSGSAKVDYLNTFDYSAFPSMCSFRSVSETHYCSKTWQMHSLRWTSPLYPAPGERFQNYSAEPLPIGCYGWSAIVAFPAGPE